MLPGCQMSRVTCHMSNIPTPETRRRPVLNSVRGVAISFTILMLFYYKDVFPVFSHGGLFLMAATKRTLALILIAATAITAAAQQRDPVKLSLDFPVPAWPANGV